VVAVSSVASAQSARTWVSGVGSDSNPCSRTAPCASFSHALTQTSAGGEIDCLDPGEFGAVIVNKAITIDCDSGPGGVTLTSTSISPTVAFDIIAANTDIVTLRGMKIIGVPGSVGVEILSAQTVHLVNIKISSVTTGVSVSASAQIFLTVEDTQIHNCFNGIQTRTSGGLVAADFSRVSIWNIHGNGIHAQNGSRLQLHSSTIFANVVGVNQDTLSGTGSVVAVFDSFFSTNGTALQSTPGASIGVSNSVFSENGIVLNPNGGQISSDNDNRPYGNPTIGIANGPPITKF